MNDAIKLELIRFFGNCEEKSTSEFIVHVGPPSFGFDLHIFFDRKSLVAKNVLPEIDEDTLEVMLSEAGLMEDSATISIDEKGALNVEITGSDEYELIKRFISITKAIYESYIWRFPSSAWRTLGEVLVTIYGYKISVLSPEYRVPQRTGWRGDIILVMPLDDGWFLSNFGKDNVKLPILSAVKDGKTYAYVPEENNILRPYDLSQIYSDVRELVELVGSSAIDIPSDESELIVKIGNLLNFIELINASLTETILPLSPTSIDQSIHDRVQQLLMKLSDEIRILRKIMSLDEALRKKIASRLAVDYARKIIQRESGMIISNVRKVSKLGAGKAVYIGKEELKLLPLGEKVLVSVIEEKGKRKIVIEPI
mgnify:CR=1 FL=1